MKNNIICQKLKNRKLLCIIGGVSVLFFFGLYLYSDICHTSIRGVVFWETLFQGRLDEFYSYFYPGVENSHFPEGTSGAAYDFLFYIIFAIWDFPLWCFEKITGLSFLASYLTRVYAKGIVLFFAIISGVLVKKIVESIDEKQGGNGFFFFLFSPLLLSVIVIIGGYDIISVFFTLLGIWYYLEEKELPFIFSFAVATVCKMFALLVFVPLVLIKQKNVGKVIIRILGGLSILIASKVIAGVGGLTNFSETNMIAHSDLVNRQMFPNDNTIIQMGNVPIFFAITFMLWWICWKKKEVTKIEIIYVALMSMSIFAIFVDVLPYWIILLVPYISIIMAVNSSNRVDNFILEMIFSVGYLVYKMGLYSWCFSLRLVNKMFGIAEGNGFRYDNCGINSIVGFMSRRSGISVDNIYSLSACCFVVGLGLFLYENRPKVLQVTKQKTDESNLYIDWIRVIIGIGVMMVPITEILRYALNIVRGGSK